MFSRIAWVCTPKQSWNFAQVKPKKNPGNQRQWCHFTLPITILYPFPMAARTPLQPPPSQALWNEKQKDYGSPPKKINTSTHSASAVKRLVKLTGLRRHPGVQHSVFPAAANRNPQRQWGWRRISAWGWSSGRFLGAGLLERGFRPLENTWRLNPRHSVYQRRP